MTHAACQRRKRKEPKRPANAPTAFDLGWQHAALKWAELATRGCPYREEDPAAADYDRGWRAAMAKFAREERRH